jgi:hypothetical protein
MKIYEVTFSYTIKVQAENEDIAETLAFAEYESIMPRLNEMNIQTKEFIEE